jgi:SAM-dependent methyltransferase
MTPTPRELANRHEFDEAYRQGTFPAMRRIERKVCGSDYGATSWATRDEADLVADMLGLRPGIRVLEIGAGSGWPALYLAARTGCEVVLTDLPLDGLHIAARRAVDDGLAGSCAATVADATRLPFRSHAFGVINHSDVLCCLVQKREVLTECRRLIRPRGRMAFSVIYVPCGLGPEDHRLAVESAPEYVETEIDYPTLLEATEWEILDRRDFTADLALACTARLRLEREERDLLLRLVGAAELDRRSELFSRRIAALKRGILKRELFLVAPTGANP